MVNFNKQYVAYKSYDLNIKSTIMRFKHYNKKLCFPHLEKVLYKNDGTNYNINVVSL